MKTRREQIQEIISERDKEIDLIYEKYKPRLNALRYKFNFKEIEDDGWVRSWRYLARGNKNEWEYDKKTGEISSRTICIVFDDKNEIREVITCSGCPQRNIVDMEDLDYYFKNNK